MSVGDVFIKGLRDKDGVIFIFFLYQQIPWRDKNQQQGYGSVFTLLYGIWQTEGEDYNGCFHCDDKSTARLFRAVLKVFNQ